tara:strand:+ start:11676 stop:12083 length:408 start_codon:yes stop_codon:yes gene_type:complete
MQILRITDAPSEHANRMIYGILETLKSYTLYECKNRSQIALGSPAETVVLDNLHNALNPSGLIRQVLNSSEAITRLILVDQQENIVFPLPQQYELSSHIVLIDVGSLPKAFYQDRDYFFDTAEAGTALLNLTRAA